LVLPRSREKKILRGENSKGEVRREAVKKGEKNGTGKFAKSFPVGFKVGDKKVEGEGIQR